MKKLFLGICTIFTVANLLVALSMDAHAAKCTSSDGDKCEGQCCMATKSSCIAGPCSVILK